MWAGFVRLVLLDGCAIVSPCSTSLPAALHRLQTAQSKLQSTSECSGLPDLMQAAHPMATSSRFL